MRSSAGSGMLATRLDALARDFVYALRTLRRNVAFTAIAITIVALGIGVNTTIFRFVNALLLQPPPVESPERVLQLWNVNPRARSPMERYVPLNYPSYAYYREHSTTFSGVAAFDGDPNTVSWVRSGRGEMAQAQYVSGNFFSVLGVKAALGTTVLPPDENAGALPAVVISDRFWRQRLDGDPAVVGTSITLNGVSATIIGVTPRGFSGLLAGFSPDMFVPLSLVDAVRHETGRLTSHDMYWLFGVGRLREGATEAQASAEVTTLAAQFAATAAPASGDTKATRRSRFAAAVFPETLVPGPFRRVVAGFVGLFQLVVGMVLLIACANAANLFLAQGVARRPELAVRSALGASRGRLVQQELVQALLVGLLAGVAGIVIAGQTAPLLLRLLPPTLPLHFDVSMDWRVMLFATALAIVSGFLFGLVPALRQTRDISTALRRDATGERRRSRLRNALVITQVAVSLVLLIAGALCWQSLTRAQSLNPGFEPERRVAAQVDLRSLGYSDSAGRIFERRLVENVSRIPGVAHVSTTQYLPLATARMELGVIVPRGGNQDTVQVQAFDVGGDFFTTLKTPVLRGRDFTWRDDESAPKVAIVNEAMARKLWPSGEAVGQTLKIGETSYDIVGVVATGKYRSLSEAAIPVIFRAERQAYHARLTLVAEIAGKSAESVIGSIRNEISKLDPNLVSMTGTLEEHLGFALFSARAAGFALSVAGILGVVLAIVGLAAVMAQSIAQRTREIGIRMALGAQRADILLGVLRDGAKLVTIGTAIGAVAAFASTRLLSGLLYGISATDPATFAGVIATLAAAALGACLIIGRRATSVDPMIAIRSD